MAIPLTDTFSPPAPAAFVSKDAPANTLAHELGHVLGLEDVKSDNNLMGPYARGVLDFGQIQRMRVTIDQHALR